MKTANSILKLAVSACLSVFVFSFVEVCAETVEYNGYSLRLKADRNGSLYKSGDIARFVLTASKGGKPANGIKLDGSITKDSVPIGKNFVGETKDGEFSVSETLCEAGFLKCDIRVFLPNENGGIDKVKLLAGAGFDVSEIKPSLPAPKDFDKYWVRQRKILSKIPLNVKMTKVATLVPDIEVYDVQADSFNGKMSAYIAFPKHALEKSLPALLTLHGAGVASSSKGTVEMWAKNGFLAMDMNAHGLPNGKPQSYYKALSIGELKDYWLKNCENRDTIFFRTLYMRIMRAMEVLTSQPQWDGKNLAVSGGSQGGGQALVAGGLDSRVNYVLAMYPALCDHGGAAVGRTTGWPHFTRVGEDGNYNRKAVEAARYIDAVNFAAKIRGRVFFMVNYADPVCEPTSCYAAYNNIKSGKEIWVNEESRHAPKRGTPTILQNKVVKILQKQGIAVKPRTDFNHTW